jgi:hypothetical protein
MLADASFGWLRSYRDIKYISALHEHRALSKYVFSDVYSILRLNMKDTGLEIWPSIIDLVNDLSYQLRESSGDLDFEQPLRARLVDPTQSRTNEDD